MEIISKPCGTFLDILLNTLWRGGGGGRLRGGCAGTLADGRLSALFYLETLFIY